MINVDGASVKTQDLTLPVGKSTTLHLLSVGDSKILQLINQSLSRLAPPIATARHIYLLKLHYT